jgi:hypothetical protein
MVELVHVTGMRGTTGRGVALVGNLMPTGRKVRIEFTRWGWSAVLAKIGKMSFPFYLNWVPADDTVSVAQISPIRKRNPTNGE